MSVPTPMQRVVTYARRETRFHKLSILHIRAENTKRNKSGDAVLKICVHMLDTTDWEAVRNMKSGLENTCITYRVSILRYTRYTSIHLCYMWGEQDFYCRLADNELSLSLSDKMFGPVVDSHSRFSKLTLAASAILLVI